jgi:RNA polymerase sigma-70 factor (ECF subfamily)
MVERAAIARTISGEDSAVAALRAGDEQAFLQLVQRLHPSMLHVALAFVSSRAVAEEVVQEAWLGVLQGLGNFEGRSSLRRWIFGVVSNCARTRGAREARTIPFSSLAAEGEADPAVEPSRFRPPDHSHWPGHWSAPPTPWPEEQVLRRESLEAVQRAVEDLPAAQRAVITLRDIEGCESSEVCDLLGISEGNQRVLLHRARSKVRARLERHLQREGSP